MHKVLGAGSTLCSGWWSVHIRTLPASALSGQGSGQPLPLILSVQPAMQIRGEHMSFSCLVVNNKNNIIEIRQHCILAFATIKWTQVVLIGRPCLWNVSLQSSKYCVVVITFQSYKSKHCISCGESCCLIVKHLLTVNLQLLVWAVYHCNTAAHDDTYRTYRK